MGSFCNPFPIDAACLFMAASCCSTGRREKMGIKLATIHRVLVLRALPQATVAQGNHVPCRPRACLDNYESSLASGRVSCAWVACLLVLALPASGGGNIRGTGSELVSAAAQTLTASGIEQPEHLEKFRSCMLILNQQKKTQYGMSPIRERSQTKHLVQV